MTVDLAWFRRFEGGVTELVLPEFPRVIPEVFAVEWEGALVLVGARDTQVLRGSAATTIIPHLLPLLNGQTRLEDVARTASLSLQTVRRVALMLYSRGLIDDGVDVVVEDKRVGSYLGRHIDNTRLNSNRLQALDRLTSARIAVFGLPAVASDICRLLLDSGVGECRTNPARGGFESTFAIVLVSDGNDLSEEFIDEESVKKPVLLAEVGEREFRIGPLLIGGHSSCFNCFKRWREPLGEPNRGEYASFSASFVATQAVNFVSRITTPPFFNRARRYDLGSGGVTARDEFFVRLPGCARCGIEATLDMTDPAMSAWRYHVVASMSPPELVDNRAFQEHSSPKNVRLLEKAQEQFHGSESVVLPSLRDSSASFRYLDDLATVLRLSAGLREDDSRRGFAPSGGNLRSAQLFVSVSNVDGLSDGAYSYDPSSHRLFRRAQSLATAPFSGWAVRKEPSCLVVGIGRLGHVHAKYGDLSYKVVALDAGVVLSYLHRAAQLRGVTVREEMDYDFDAVADALGISQSRGQRVVTFVAQMRWPTHPAEPASNGDLLAGLLKVVDHPAPVITTAPGRAGADQLLAAMVARTSTRSFGPKAVDVHLLSRLFERASAVREERRSAGAVAFGATLFLACLLPGPDGAPGIFRFDLDGRRFVRVRDAYTPGDAANLITQSGLAASPYVAIVCQDLAEAFGRRGARGYREAYEQAGYTAAGLALDAQAAGVASCIWACLSSESARDLMQANGYSECPMIGCSLGYG